MQQVAQPSAARAQRMIHLALLGGLALLGATFYVLLRVLEGPLTNAPGIGLALAGVALAILALAISALRGKVPARRADQTAEDYWSTTDARGATIVLWVAIDAAGVLSWTGYVLTGRLAPAGVALLAIITLAAFRPSLLEGEGAP